MGRAVRITFGLFVCLVGACRPESIEKSGPRAVPAGDRLFTSVEEPSALAARSLLARDFGLLDKYVADKLADQNTDRNAVDLARFYSGFDDLGGSDRSELARPIVDEWVARDSRSPTALIARGKFLIGYAWKARGGKLAKDTPFGAQRLFRVRLQAAAVDLARAAEMNPRDPNAAAGMITVIVGLGRPREEMERWYRRAIDVAPGHFHARLNKTMFLAPKWRGSEDEVLAFGRECARDAERHPYAGLILAEALEEVDSDRRISGEKEIYLARPEVWEQVQSAYDRFFAKYPDDIRARFYFIRMAYRAERWELVTETDRIVGNRWVEGTGWRSLETYRECVAWAHRKHGATLPDAQALSHFQRAAELTPGYPDAHYWHGVTLERLGKMDEAVAAYERSIAADPTYSRPYARLMALAGRLPDPCAEARRLLQASAKLEFSRTDGELVEKIKARCPD